MRFGISGLRQGDSLQKPATQRLTALRALPMFPAVGRQGAATAMKVRTMKVLNSLKTAKLREKGCRIVRRRGRIYVINKKNPRFKARQG